MPNPGTLARMIDRIVTNTQTGYHLSGRARFPSSIVCKRPSSESSVNVSTHLILQFVPLFGPELWEPGLGVVLTEHNNGSNVVIPNESPEIAYGVFKRMLRQDEFVAVVVALQEGGVDVV